MKKKEIFKSERRFGIYDFKISHEQLLLRSSKDSNFEQNIDIIFYGVKFIQLPSHLFGLAISLIEDSTDLPATIPDGILVLLKDNEIFEIDTQTDQHFFIVCKLIQVYQNVQEFGETSLGITSNEGRRDLIIETKSQ
jgi:hypothetical protein